MSVYFDKKRNKFIARPTINGKRTYLGQFYTRAAAEYAVKKTKLVYGTQFEVFLPPLVPSRFSDIERPSYLERILNFFFTKRG